MTTIPRTLTLGLTHTHHGFAVCGVLAAVLAPGLGRADTPQPEGAAPPFESPDRLPPDTADPPVDAICKAAVALALAEPERARGFLNRARAAGWLPEVRFRVYRRFARTEGLTFDDTGAGVVAPVDISAVDDVRYEWRATLDLSRMVFNPDELQAHFEALRMSDVRRDIQSLVIRLYFERRRLVIERSPGESATARSRMTEGRAADRRNLRILEIEAQLDALSGGAFSSGVTQSEGNRSGNGNRMTAP